MLEEQYVAVSSFRREYRERFSRREIECMYYLIRGLTAKQIARSLNLSPRTIESYCCNIKRKLNCHRKADVISRILDDGVLYRKVLAFYRLNRGEM